MSWELDPNTGDYVLEGGHFRRDDGFTGRAQLALLSQRGSCPGYPDHGSRLHELKQMRSPTKAALLAPDMVREALEPMVRDGDIAAIEIAAEAQTVGNLPGVAIEIVILDGGQRPHAFDMFQEVG